MHAMMHAHMPGTEPIPSTRIGWMHHTHKQATNLMSPSPSPPVCTCVGMQALPLSLSSAPLSLTCWSIDTYVIRSQHQTDITCVCNTRASGRHTCRRSGSTPPSNHP
mmetsp:Transcript_46125/g.114691  ORF Transcript_46125/g.114691 Transcript_46125/m.114691 type:complete len:107 (-) Transcript_46125:67-387(-)